MCGRDSVTGSDYTYRRKWLRNRIIFLSKVFSIRIAAFAIMENHFHTVLVVDSSEAENWSNQEVIKRWHKIFRGTDLSHRFLSGDSLDENENMILGKNIETWRKNLCSISWYMRCTKEPLARLANKEDQCKGRFWDGRFHCQALLDKKSILTCMAYVDLNPLRAKMCKNPEQDRFTSLRLRIKQIQRSTRSLKHSLNLLPESPRADERDKFKISISLAEYLSIVDTTARLSRSNKRGVLNQQERSIFQRLGFTVEQWISAAMFFNKNFYTYVGTRTSLLTAMKVSGKNSMWGIRNCEALLGS